MEEVKHNRAKYTTIPHSELALHLRIAGKKGRITKTTDNWAIVELDGKQYEGLVSELVDIEDR